ncbi:MAG: TerC family protein [Oligoflexia bacterium]|nr:TerC family protein [Oligoflexia bacterium]
MEALLNSEALVALLSLTAMEIVLGIDNIVFIAILVGKLPKQEQAKARSIGIALALLTRLALLFSISWVMGLTEPLFSVFSRSFSGRDLILLAGGLFLIAKSTYEIHDRLEAATHGPDALRLKKAAFLKILIQIAILDVVFSLDSVITAVGMAQQLAIMVIAMVVAVAVMLFASGAISDFVHRHPTIKILALSFLLLIGVMLFAEGTGAHVDKGYIYFAMFFSLAVELLNMRLRRSAAAPNRAGG